MADPQLPLKQLRKQHDFLVCLDSDGCVFDTAEFKNKECFIPLIIRYWNLQSVARFARTAAEFVNLYSKWRGANRFLALVETFRLLREWPAVRRRGAIIPEAAALDEWIGRERILANTTLRAEVVRTGDPVLRQALEWSEAVNRDIAVMVRNVPPFPLVRESLEELSGWADVVVCSTTPVEALTREWREQGIDGFVQVIAGQELGPKRDQIALAMAGRYAPERTIMLGDAPGDQAAAEANGAHFFPILSGGEEESWERFHNESLARFHDGRYTAEYQAELAAEFHRRLPDTPPWLA